MRNLFKILVVGLWGLMVAFGLFGFWLSGQYVVPIMMYHHVSNESYPDVNTISPANFIRHLDFLKKNHYRVISLKELAKAIETRRLLSRKTVVITFDDGYEDNYLYAFPALKQYGFPATIFVVAGEVGKEGYLTPKQMKEMHQSGIDFGSHTVSHAYLPELDEAQQVQEIENSKKILEEKTGLEVDHFSYPSGGFSEQIKTMVQKAGYKAACTTNRGYSRLNGDVYELKRNRFGDEDNTETILWMKLSGFYNTFRQARAPN